MVFNMLVWWDKKPGAIFIGELGTETINFEEKEMIPLTNKELKSYEKQKVCHICKKKVLLW